MIASSVCLNFLHDRGTVEDHLIEDTATCCMIFPGDATWRPRR
ncbi:MAG TPA: hypothetical protein PLU94_06380 [Methanoregulaceae archaeon]|nr:hypothetical protein [Methanoregulaceae archaeon]